jgi:hypothetical protein
MRLRGILDVMRFLYELTFKMRVREKGLMEYIYVEKGLIVVGCE